MCPSQDSNLSPLDLESYAVPIEPPCHPLKMFKLDEALSVCLSLCVCVLLASDSSETFKVIAIKFGTVTASDNANASRVNYIDLDLHSCSEVISDEE